jgi:hypothetical protein
VWELPDDISNEKDGAHKCRHATVCSDNQHKAFAQSISVDTATKPFWMQQLGTIVPLTGIGPTKNHLSSKQKAI